MSQVPAEFYPKKVFHCPCLAFFISEIYNVNIHEYSQILKAISYCKMAPEQVYSTRTKQNANSIITCAHNLKQFLVAERKYSCTSKAEGDFWFKGLDRHYCKQCIKYYLKKMTKTYLNKVSNE